MQQEATTSSTLQREGEESVKIRRNAARAVQPTLDSLKAWHADQENEVNSMAKIRSVRKIFKSPTIVPPNPKLVKLVHHYHPPRGEVPIHVCDFGDGRAAHFTTTLGRVEECWKWKPEWATVRWIHAPLGVGLTHSSVEDLFRHAGEEGWAFSNTGGPNWPYIACEILSLQHVDLYRNSRDVCVLARKVRQLKTELDRTTYRGDSNPELKNDIEWRAKHLDVTLDFLDLVQNDIGYNLADGRSLGINGPYGSFRPLDTKLDEQVFSRYPFFNSAQIVRTPFRCFHRADGFVLTLSSLRGVNYLDKRFSEHLHLPPECLFDFPEAFVLGQVWRQFSSTGTKTWHRATVEWFLVYLMTELVCTPHSISQGLNAPTLQFAYQNIIQNFKRRRFDPTKRGESVGLVKDYVLCVDELGMLVNIMAKQLDFLYRMKKDCIRMEADPMGMNNPGGKKSTSRVDWAILNLEEQFTYSEAMLKDLRSSMLAVSLF